jgi:hypothetical protein
MSVANPEVLPGEPKRLLLFVGAFCVAWTVRAFALAPLDRGLRPPFARQLYLDGVRLSLWVVPVLLHVRFFDRGPSRGSLS